MDKLNLLVCVCGSDVVALLGARILRAVLHILDWIRVHNKKPIYQWQTGSYNYRITIVARAISVTFHRQLRSLDNGPCFVTTAVM